MNGREGGRPGDKGKALSGGEFRWHVGGGEHADFLHPPVTELALCWYTRDRFNPLRMPGSQITELEREPQPSVLVGEGQSGNRLLVGGRAVSRAWMPLF